MTRTYQQRLPQEHIATRESTGGCSSSFSPRSGFALRFANTPSLEREKAEKGVAPVWGLVVTLDVTEGTTAGSLVTAPGRFGLLPSRATRCSVSD